MPINFTFQVFIGTKQVYGSPVYVQISVQISRFHKIFISSYGAFYGTSLCDEPTVKLKVDLPF